MLDLAVRAPIYVGRMHSWLIIGGALLIALVVARTVFGAAGRLVGLLVVLGVLVLGVGTAAGGLSGLRERADCIQHHPQIGSALVHELEHGCQVHPAPSPTALAAALRRQGIGARAVTGAAVYQLHPQGLTVPAGVTAAVVPTERSQRFVVLYTTSHATAKRVKRMIAARLRQSGIDLALDGSHVGVDGSVVYVDATSPIQTPVANAVTGL
jgi:hypothetical protein